MSFEWPLDKLSLINSALSQTGDNLCNVAEDGSDEWNVCSPAYERGLAYLMEQHGWGFATEVRTLNANGTAPADTQWDTAYDIPIDLVHLLWVRIDSRPGVWDILANQLVLNAQGGPPPPDPAVTPSVVTVKGVFQTATDITASTPTFVLALQTFVLSGIYRGVHKDSGQADKMFLAAKEIMQEARSRYDMQKPKRAMFNSRIAASRRIRRPWPPVGNNSWGGSGSPG